MSCPHPDPTDLSGLREQIIANAKVLHPLLTGDEPLTAKYFDLIILRKGRSFWHGSKYYSHVLFRERSQDSEGSTQHTLLIAPPAYGREKALKLMLDFTMVLLARYLPNPPVATMDTFEYTDGGVGFYYKKSNWSWSARR